MEQYRRIQRVEVSDNPCWMVRQRKFGNKWEMLIWTIGETSTCNTPTLTPGRASFFRTQDKMTRDLKTQSEDEVSVRRVFPDDGIFTNLVKDSISAQVRDGIRPMFVNNYYVGDNSWRPGVTEGSTKTAQQINASNNRSSTAVQTAISSLGEDCKSESYMQTGISRVKAMGSNDGRYNMQSPLVVGAGKNSNSNGMVNKQL